MDDEDGQYNKSDDIEENKPNETFQAPIRFDLENGNTQDNQDDEYMDTEMEQEEEYYEGQFDDEDYKV